MNKDLITNNVDYLISKAHVNEASARNDEEREKWTDMKVWLLSIREQINREDA